jgi:hypothetical protein
MIQTGFTPGRPGMLPLVDGDNLIALLTWTEAIRLGTMLAYFGAAEAGRCGATRDLMNETTEAALLEAERAADQASRILAGGEA